MFTVGAVYAKHEVEQSDTSKSRGHVRSTNSPMRRAAPAGRLRLVGVELLDDAVELPSFRHPHDGSLHPRPRARHASPEVLALCDFTVKIPTRFCLNVGVAAAIVMYDRLLSHGRFAERPVRAGGPTASWRRRRLGAPIWEKKRRRRGGA